MHGNTRTDHPQTTENPAPAALPFVSILVPMRNEEGFITRCLATLRAQAYPVELLEILVMDGESTDASAEIVTAITREDPRVRLLANPGRTQAAGLNLGISAARGEIIVRADAHATYGPEYVRISVDHLIRGEAENVGGLQRAEGNTPFSRALTVALASPLGAGNAAYRLATAPCYTDTVWLGAWRRTTLEELGGYDTTMTPNEDYEMNIRLRRCGGRILLDPALPGLYYPRSSPARLWRQYFRYGQAKVRVLRKHPKSLMPRQMVPPLAVAAILLAVLLTPLTPLPLALIGGGYLLALFLGSLLASAKHGLRHLLLLPVIYLIIHFAWGLGAWCEVATGKRSANLPLQI